MIVGRRLDIKKSGNGVLEQGGDELMKRTGIVFLFSILLLSLGGCSGTQEDVPAQTGKESEIRTFADWTDNEEFAKIPAMIVDDAKVGNVTDYGGKDYVLDINGTSLGDYQDYLTLLEKNGFSKYADNGAEGLNGNVYTATYTKETLVVTVTQRIKCDQTSISVCDGLSLSPNLLYDAADTADNQEGKQTTLHMIELYNVGNSFLIQLKNGHFIMNDGGQSEDLPYLLDYMETLVPDGEKPVVDAWFISHAHDDHVGWSKKVTEDPSLIDRICVEAFYFSQPSNAVATAFGSTDVQTFIMNYKFFKNSQGGTPELYRPQTGQRYYFNDLTVDVLFTQEQLATDDYSGDFNDSSTWLMYTIEGQKFLLCGDAEYGSVKAVMNTYDSAYFNLDVYAVFHHGINVYDYFTDFCSFQTLLYPNYRCGSIHADNEWERKEENAHLIASAKEAIAWGNGTVVLSFPYKVGTAVKLPATTWTYNPETPDYTGTRVEDYQTYIKN